MSTIYITAENVTSLSDAELQNELNHLMTIKGSKFSQMSLVGKRHLNKEIQLASTEIANRLLAKMA